MQSDDIDLLNVKKVLWRNGDVISQDHFIALENWVEKLIVTLNSKKGNSGLFRHTDIQPSFNDAKNIRLRQVQDRLIQVEVENFQGINRFGEFLRITQEESFEINLRSSAVNIEGPWYLYLLPLQQSVNGKLSHSSDPVTGVELYEKSCTVSALNADRRGVIIGRLQKQNEDIGLDSDYIPPTIFVDGTSAGVAAWESTHAKFLSWKKLIDEYLLRIRPTQDVLHAWMLETRLLQANEWFVPLLTDEHKESLCVLTEYEQFFKAVKAALRIFARELEILEKDVLKQITLEVIALLEQPWLIKFDGQIELGASLHNAGLFFENLFKYFPNLPVAQDVTTTIPIAAVEFTKQAGMHQFIIKFEKEESFVRGKSKINIYLREFSKADPTQNRVKVALGSAIFAQLTSHLNLIRKIESEPFSYHIECPLEISSRERASLLTLYLPPPLGDGIANLKSHVRLIVRE